MPVYIVRWPEPVVSLVSAADEDELMYRLDEAADPGGCTWQVYKGPLWVDFELPVKVDIGAREDKRKPLSPEDMEIDIGELALEPMQLVPSDTHSSDTGFEMNELIRKFAFPALQRALDAAPAGDPEAIDPETVKAAVTEDMQPLLEYTWRQAQLEKRDDPEAAIMRQLGVTVKFGALKHPGLGGAKPNGGERSDEPDDE